MIKFLEGDISTAELQGSNLVFVRGGLTESIPLSSTSLAALNETPDGYLEAVKTIGCSRRLPASWTIDGEARAVAMCLKDYQAALAMISQGVVRTRSESSIVRTAQRIGGAVASFCGGCSS